MAPRGPLAPRVQDMGNGSWQCGNCNTVFDVPDGQSTISTFKEKLPLCAFDETNLVGICQPAATGHQHGQLTFTANSAVVQNLAGSTKTSRQGGLCGRAYAVAHAQNFQGGMVPILQATAAAIAASPHVAQLKSPALRQVADAAAQAAITAALGGGAVVAPAGGGAVVAAVGVTGTTVDIHTLDERTLHIPINDIIKPGYKKVVPTEGMPLSTDPTQKGDLIIEFNIEFPQSLTPERKELVRSSLL